MSVCIKCKKEKDVNWARLCFDCWWDIDTHEMTDLVIEQIRSLRVFADGMLKLVDEWSATGWMDGDRADALVDEYRKDGSG